MSIEGELKKVRDRDHMFAIGLMCNQPLCVLIIS